MNPDHDLELADLQAAWAKLDTHSLAQLPRLAAATDALVEDRAHTLTRRAMAMPTFDMIVAGAALVGCLATAAHTGTTTYFVCLGLVAACLASLIVASAMQIATLARLDVAATIVTAQRQLARARSIRIFEWKWVLLLSPLLWTPFLVVCVEQLLAGLRDGAAPGIFSAQFVVASLAIGAAASLVLWWISGKVAAHFGGTSFVRNLLDDLAGRNLSKARDFLARLDRFERD